MSDIFASPLWSMVPQYFRNSDTLAAQDRGLPVGALEKFFSALEAEITEWCTSLEQIEASSDIGRCSQTNTLLKLYSLGISLPKNDFAMLRRVVANIPQMLFWKGDTSRWSSIIYLATGYVTAVSVPNKDTNVFVVGDSVVSDAPVGWNYRTESKNTFVVGQSSIGYGVVGASVVDPEFPHRVLVQFYVDPPPSVIDTVMWVLSIIKKATDLPTIIIPETTQWWIIGESVIGRDTVVYPGPFVVDETAVSGGYIAA